MTWTLVNAPGGTGMLNDSTSLTPSITPSAIGDMLFLAICNTSNSTVTATAVTSSNITWTLAGSAAGTYNCAVFLGRATSTSAAAIAVTWSGTAPGSHSILCEQFHSTVGSWTVDKTGTVTSNRSAWPSLTPAGSAELYVGHCINSSSASGGTTSGFVYFVSNTQNGEAHDFSVSAAAGPTWADATQNTGVMLLVAEGAGVTVPPKLLYQREARQAAPARVSNVAVYAGR